MEPLAVSISPRPSALAERYRCVRAASLALAAPLSAEDCAAQSMPDASPVKWHLAHTTWFFETFVLERAVPDHRPFAAPFRALFNSYYQSVGEPYARPQRGLLTRPSLAEVVAYRAAVDDTMLAWLEAAGPGTFADAVELGLQHEQQHQELILTDVLHLLAQNPLRPAYREDLAPPPRVAAAPLRWHRYEPGLRAIGSDGPGFRFDNEGPRHRVFADGFELASRPVTNAEFLAFVEDGGYARPEAWLSDGWAAACAGGWSAPRYWERRDGAWWDFGLGGLAPLDLDAPVCHVSYYEADAHARWAGVRLPGEAEWEIAAAGVAVDGNFAEHGLLRPAPHPAPDPGPTPLQLFGDVWEWTASPYIAYPGFRPLAGALGEYNGKFMCNQMVLRGGSCASPRDHLRASYRNFFPPGARWQFSGVRLARDAR